MIEKWKPVEGLENFYHISSKGRILNLERVVVYKTGKKETLGKKEIRNKGGKIKKSNYNSEGYEIVRLVGDDGKAITTRMHVLVAHHFIGPRPNGMEISHQDGNPANNDVSNLAYESRRTNNAKRMIHGTLPYGAESKKSKLTIDQVLLARKVRESCKHGEWRPKAKELALTFGVALGTLENAASGRNWKHLP